MIDENIIGEYLYFYRVRLANELIQLQNNISLRVCDELDYLEFIILTTRIKEFDKISGDLYNLLKYYN